MEKYKGLTWISLNAREDGVGWTPAEINTRLLPFMLERKASECFKLNLIIPHSNKKTVSM